jgi:hypothetical protein
MLDKVYQKPQQRLSTKKKLGKGKFGKAWRESNVDYYASKNSVLGSLKYEFEEMYKMAAGYINDDDYTYMLDPYNTNSTRKIHAELRNYDIVSPILQMLMGEKSNRKSDPIVVAINSDITTIQEQKLKELVTGELQQMFINTLNTFADSGIVSRDIKGYEQIQTEVDSIKDDKAITGQHALNYIVEEKEIKRKLRKGFYDMICTGYVFSYKDIRYKNLIYDTYTPTDCGYTCSQDTEFIEDGEAAWVRRYMTVSDILDEFYDELTKEELERLEKFEDTGYNTTDYTSTEAADLINSMTKNGLFRNIKWDTKSTKNDQHEVVYVNWKSKVKIGLLKGVDAFGNEYEEIVEEDFPVRPDETIEWFWVNQTWEGTRIGDDIYKRIRPISFQRGTLDNPSACKLLINGRNVLSRHFFTKSIVKKLQPFQKRYNAVHWHIEKVMNKNKDKIVLMPKNLIPTSGGLNTSRMMHFADKHGFLFTDEIDPKSVDQFKSIQVLDLSLGDYLKYLYDALAFIRLEAEEAIGITRARKGQTMASDGKGVTEQAIFQSAVISEELFLEYEEFEKREYQGLLDLSKYAWQDGKKAWYIDSEKRRVLLDIIGREHRETEYAISVQNGKEEHQKLNEITDMKNVQAMIQNGTAPHIIAKMKNVKSMEEMIDILEIDHEKFEANQQQAQQAEQQAVSDQLEQQERHHQDEIDIKLYEIDAKLMMSQQQSVSLDENAENDLKREDLNIKREELQIKREEIASRERMSYHKDKTALKNKVSGEK